MENLSNVHFLVSADKFLGVCRMIDSDDWEGAVHKFLSNKSPVTCIAIAIAFVPGGFCL